MEPRSKFFMEVFIMKHQNVLRILALVMTIAMMLSVASCFGGKDEVTTPEKPAVTTPATTTPAATTPKETTPEPVVTTTPEPVVTTPEPVVTTTPEPDVTTPDTPVTPPEPQKKTLKVLAIGNSFSDDGMEHLAEILVGEGYTDFILGNLYYGGCSMDGHKGRIESGAEQYDFRVNTGSGWSSSKRSIQYGLDYAEWDIVTIQQVSGQSGIPESYGNMQYIIDYVRNTFV